MLTFYAFVNYCTHANIDFLLNMLKEVFNYIHIIELYSTVFIQVLFPSFAVYRSLCHKVIVRALWNSPTATLITNTSSQSTSWVWCKDSLWQTGIDAAVVIMPQRRTRTYASVWVRKHGLKAYFAQIELK